MFTSNKTVSQFIADVKAQKPNKYDNSAYVTWINEVEQPLYSKILEEYRENDTEYAGVDNADFPLDTKTDLGVRFEDIRKILVDGVEYSKMSLAYFPDGSYAKTGEGLDIRPRPAEADTVDVAIIYRERPELKVVADILTQYINLPDDFIKIVTYYCFKQVHLLNKEYGEAQNWSQLYDNAVADFIVWYSENKANFGN